MKTVILAGGFGSCISEESVYKPKPMIEIGAIMAIMSSLFVQAISRNISKNGFQTIFCITQMSVLTSVMDEMR